ncbi:Hsp20 family protein [Candidatus Liberibacter asiaticus]|uniref:Small heat shock protein n=2 Tax=Liberibacter asiaticus TaxID=34021 RepID=C6XFE1_LIBAP|nr:Hsp20 family protein [Candidatus Liberibacter asiaticus]ACT57094.1 small heat shock protein [Candidatus Liberibacter asiaticus str. psy62]AGH16941.1 small heat shock protein [Candidatus Liberibacter asiaticus str. gxpsy]ALK07280.1 Hsp20 family protein [Candidatus Liberibacter asiaticus]ASK52769.1 heat-shock protein [Candidatus Liberibacter asiaticus]AWL14088.1 heat-shock protein [Candidatus Liberibacter asiaticus]
MRLDVSRIYNSAVGYDTVLSMLDGLGAPSQTSAYPPYDIERTGENAYRITIAVSGFHPSEITIEVDSSILMVRGEKKSEEKETVEYLHRGIAKRAFERRFQLADFVEVMSASLENGLLYLELLRSVPERMKPRRIEISQSPQESTKMIEEKKKSVAA